MTLKARNHMMFKFPKPKSERRLVGPINNPRHLSCLPRLTTSSSQPLLLTHCRSQLHRCPWLPSLASRPARSSTVVAIQLSRFDSSSSSFISILLHFIIHFPHHFSVSITRFFIHSFFDSFYSIEFFLSYFFQG